GAENFRFLLRPMRIERILCPTDLTPGSDAALRYGAALARAYDAQLLQIYCKDSAQAQPPLITGDPNALMNAAFRKFATADEMEAWNWESSIEKCEDPGDCIAREAARCRADLIIMRSRRRPHRAALLGSVAESVSRTAPCPVMVIHTDERDWIVESNNAIGLKRVLVAYDFS